MNEKTFKDYFVDSSEKQITVLGGSFLHNFISNGDLSNGFCVVTDKRVYFKGKCYYKEGKHYRRSTEERTVDLKDVTGSGFMEAKNISFLFLAVAFAIAGFLITFFVCSGLNAPVGVGIGGGLFIAPCAALIPVILYFVLRMKLFEISYAGGKIAFKSTSYGKAEMQQFQKDLRKAKDDFNSNNSVHANMASTGATGSGFEELKRLKDMGMITDEEFEEKRKELLKRI